MDESGFNNLVAQFGVYTGTVIVCFISGFVPVVNAEIYLLLVAAMIPKSLFIPVLLLATIGQMSAKSLIYLTGKGVIHLPFKRIEKGVASMEKRMTDWESGIGTFMFVSAFSGFPPFYLSTFAAGAMRLRFNYFLLSGFSGRLLRFGVVMFFPQLFKELFM
ncbi:MAG: hypothetical protein ACYC5A_04510 [Thermoleophilia bacterium]